jgi:hypothetical protein
MNAQLGRGSEFGGEIAKSAWRGESSGESIRDRAGQPFLFGPLGSGLGERPPGRCDPKSVALLNVGWIHGQLMDAEAYRRAPEAVRDRQMNDRGVEISQIMHGERSGMADNSDPTAPDGPTDQVVVLVTRPLGNSEEPAVDPGQFP